MPSSLMALQRCSGRRTTGCVQVHVQAPPCGPVQSQPPHCSGQVWPHIWNAKAMEVPSVRNVESHCWGQRIPRYALEATAVLAYTPCEPLPESCPSSSTPDSPVPRATEICVVHKSHTCPAITPSPGPQFPWCLYPTPQRSFCGGPPPYLLPCHLCHVYSDSETHPSTFILIFSLPGTFGPLCSQATSCYLYLNLNVNPGYGPW